MSAAGYQDIQVACKRAEVIRKIVAIPAAHLNGSTGRHWPQMGAWHMMTIMERFDVGDGREGLLEATVRIMWKVGDMILAYLGLGGTGYPKAP